MFYRPADGHSLPHDPFSAIVSPRPIAWVSTRSADHIDNLAPYSFFNAVAYDPPQVMFASTGIKPDQQIGKDSVANIRNSRVFCVNMIGYEMRNMMNQTAAALPKTESEFDRAEIERAECETIDCARVAKAPANLECRLTKIVDLPGQANAVVFGEVTGIHMRDDCMREGYFDIKTFNPLARLGYHDYAQIDATFSLNRPKS